MNKQFRIASKYLIERSSYFQKYQLVLSLQEGSLYMQPLSRDREEKEGAGGSGITKIELESIVYVQASERNAREFTIGTLPPNRKKLPGNKQGNPQQRVFTCKERNRLLTEVIHKLHILNNDGLPQLVEKAWHQNDMYYEKNPNQNDQPKLQGVVIKFHPTIIQVIIVQGSTSRKRNMQSSINKTNKANEGGRSTFGGTGGGITGIIGVNTGGDEENKHFEENNNFPDESAQDYYEEEDEELHIEEYESGDNQGDQNTLLTPFKGSMLGGTVIGEGEESVVAGLLNEQAAKSSFVKQHFIYLCEIDRVFAVTNYLIIVKKNKEIEKFIFKTEESMRAALDLMRKNYIEHFKTSLFYINYQEFEKDKIFDEIEFLKKGKNIVYSQEVSSFTWDGIVNNLLIELDEHFIYEVQKIGGKVRKRCQLLDLEMVRVQDKHQHYNLVLLFKRETEMVLNVPSLEARERLLSAILTLRSFIIPSTGFIDQLTILINQKIDFSQRILGLDPLETASYTQEYEGLLFRKISENINYKDNMKINNLIEETLLNAVFSSLVKIDLKHIRIIIKEIQAQLESYLVFEIHEPHIVDQVLSRNNDSQLINYFSYKKIGQNQLTKIEEKPELGGQQNQSNNLQQDTISNIGYNFEPDRVKIFEQQYEQTAKYLSVLHLFLNSKVFLNEMAEYNELMLLLIKVLMSKSPYLSLLASEVIRAMVHHYSGNESKIESQNKRVLIRGNSQFQQTQQETLNQQSIVNNADLGDNLYLINAIFDYLLYFDHLLEVSKITKPLHLYNINNILRSIFNLRRSSTGREELQIFAHMVVEEDQDMIYMKSGYIKEHKITQDAKPITKHQMDDPLRNKPLFHLIDKFALLDSKNFDVQYMFTLCLNESLSYFKKYENEKLHDFQQYILTYSIQFIWQIYLLLESQIQEQRKLSIQTLSKLLYQNTEGIQLLLRCFPKTLIERVDTPLDLLASLSWQEQEWTDFFYIVQHKSLDSATEQWNDDTRQDLKVKLQKELNDFIEAKKIHKLVIEGGDSKELVLPNHEFNRDKKVISRWKNLKWNYMEFQVRYYCLNHKYLVWKYYLRKLLIEQNLDERQRPYFLQRIDKPILFWQELKIRFMSSFDKEEQKIILKCMCVLYNNHYQSLRQLKSMSYFLKLLDQEQFEHCHFILLQLIHVSLSIKSEYAPNNMRKFIKADGLRILLNCMKLVFKELLIKQNDQPISPLKNSIYRQNTGNFNNSNVAKILQDNPNYTNSDTNSRYFRRNSEYVCMGILSIKIFDLIFNEMVSIDYVPLPSNREFIMNSKSLATLTQMLMIENTDLTREITIFIQMHLDNHYSFYKLRNSGMIEFLILGLNTRNGDRALNILEKFQEVCIDYNNNLKLGLYNSNDLKMIQEDKFKFEAKLKGMNAQNEIQDIFDQNALQTEGKRLPILAESIFLRYLPIPFIKLLYEKGKQQFLQIYKMQFYESPILIWNSDLRLILETSIKDHARDFISKLQEFAVMPSSELVDPENMPIYKSKFKNIVKYPQIESEVRCGRYYLRVWINQKKDSENFFKIPREEEDEFYKNLQAELRYCIYEEQFADSSKIIIIFKSCLLALYTFEKKRILYLDEVKRILMDTCKNQTNYNDTVKEMVYIGIKIIYNAFKLNTENLKEILTKNGVEIIVEIFNMILKYSFADSNLFSQDFAKSDFVDESIENSLQQVDSNYDQLQTTKPAEAQNNQKIRIDRIEAKTLSLCVQSFNIILNTDVQAFVDLPLAQRINLFKQISRIFDLSFSLLPLFKQRQLTTYEMIGDSKTYNSSIFNMQSNLSPKGKGGSKHNKRNKSKRSMKRKRSQNKNQQKGQGSNNHQLLNVSGSAHNAMSGVIIKSLNEKLQAAGAITFNAKIDVEARKKRFKRDTNIDYKNRPLLKVIKKHMDDYSISLIFDISRSIFELTREITKNPILHPELIASGMAWKALQHIQFYLKEEVKRFRDLDISIKSATVTLKNLISFAHELAFKEAESFAFKNLTRETEKDIMMKFWQCITRVFGNKMLETLLSQFTITNGILGFANFEPRKFLRQYAVKEEKSPELVWNDETRQELAVALEEQIQNLHFSYCNVLLDFEYTINQKELRVKNIFVRHFNTTNDFKPQDMLDFSKALVEKLKEFTQDGIQYIADLSQSDSENCIELVKAFKNLLIQEHLLVDDHNLFQDDITTFCDLIKVKNEGQLDATETQRLKEMSHLVLEIIKHISKTGGLHFVYLKDNMDFMRLLIRSLYGKEKEIVDMDDIITILQNILSYDELDISLFLIRTGLIYFMLNQIFDKTAQKKVRVELTKLILQTSQYTAQVYRRYIPQYFFVEIQSKYNSEPEVEKLIAFIQDFDQQEFENVFIIWTNQLRKEGHERIKSNCKKIIESLSESNYNFDLDEQELYNPYLEHEIRVCDVILRIYNRNPAVFINTKLNTFILNVSMKLQSVAQELFKLGQVEDYNFDSDQGIIAGEILSPKQSFIQKKFKYLCHQSLLMLTSILLSIEQLLNNDFNQNRLMANKKEDKNAETKFYKQIIEKTTEQTQLDHKVYPILGFWLQTQVFLSRNIPVEIRITFLQIIYLIIDVADAVKVLKDNQSLMQFITDSIEKIHSDKFSKTIEEALILFITQKMLRRDSEPTPSLITTSLTKLVKIYEKKKKLRKLIEYILGLMANDQQYKQSVVEYIKQNQLASKMDMKIILDNHNQHSEHTEAIQRIWRAKPASSSDAKRYYDFNEGYYIEDKLDEVNILKIKLPLLSKKSIYAITKEEVVIEEGATTGGKEFKINSATSSVKQETSSQLKMQQQQQHLPIQAPFLGQDDIIPGQMSAKDNLAATLGFQPMLNEEFDLEPIEKIAEDDPLSEGEDL